MLPKDLLNDLESGDRTSVHLEAKEMQTQTFDMNQSARLLEAFQRASTNTFQQATNQVWRGNLGISQGSLLGGITRW